MATEFAKPDGDTADPEVEALLAVTSPARRQQDVQQALERELDWTLLLERAAVNGVLHQLAVAVKKAGRGGDLPPLVQERVNRLVRQAVLLDGTRERTLTDVIEAFDRERIPVMLLKGLGLAERFYDDPCERPSADVDILVPGTERDAAGALLTSMGYTAQRREFYEEHHFHIPYTAPAGRPLSTVELHWQVTKPHARVVFDVESWWAGSRKLSLRAGSIRVPPPAEELAYVSHHVFTRGAVTLKGLQDVARFVDRRDTAVAWDDVHAAAERAGSGPFLGQALRLSRSLWGLGSSEQRNPPREGFLRRWLVRNLFEPRTVMDVGDTLWWPFKRLCYWSLLDPAVAPVTSLFRRSPGAEWDDANGTGPTKTRRGGRAVLSLGLAAALCCLPRKIFPARFRRE